MRGGDKRQVIDGEVVMCIDIFVINYRSEGFLKLHVNCVW